MHFEQIYLGCLSQASYLIGDGGEAVVVDPRRDVDEYLTRATAAGLTIRHVIATHVHADFVAGLAELREATGATIHMGRRFDGELPSERLGDGDSVRVGNVAIEALETPGHTPESICLLVRDQGDPSTPAKLLTGDTMFIGDVGRPDLVGSLGKTSEEMAQLLYRSLRTKIMPLPDDVEIYPGHGAGSACGKNLSSETWSTLGDQRVQNWALADMTEDEFVAELTTNLSDPPRYFFHAAELNRCGPKLNRELPPPDQLESVDPGTVVLDVRAAAEYGAGHREGAINIGLGGQFASWSGTLIDAQAPIAIAATDRAMADEARMRLARVGLENVVGWVAAQDSARLPQMDVHRLADQLDDRPEWQVIDVRRPAEFAAGRVPGAVSAPLERLPGEPERVADLDRDRPTAVICAGGYRSSTATHFLAGLGFSNLHNVTGGTNAWLGAGYPAERG